MSSKGLEVAEYVSVARCAEQREVVVPLSRQARAGPFRELSNWERT